MNGDLKILCLIFGGVLFLILVVWMLCVKYTEWAEDRAEQKKKKAVLDRFGGQTTELLLRHRTYWFGHKEHGVRITLDTMAAALPGLSGEDMKEIDSMINQIIHADQKIRRVTNETPGLIQAMNLMQTPVRDNQHSIRREAGALLDSFHLVTKFPLHKLMFDCESEILKLLENAALKAEQRRVRLRR